MQEDIRSSLSRPMRYEPILKGDGFVSLVGPHMSKPRFYRSGNKTIIRRFIDKYVRQPDGRPLKTPSFVGFVPVGVSDAEVDEEGLPIFYAVDSDSPEVNGRFYLETLELMKDDLSQQFRHRVRACRGEIVSIEIEGDSAYDRPDFQLHERPPGWGRCSSKDTTLFNSLIHSLENLERPAFTFGAKGKSLWITATLKSGSKEWFVLRPPIMESLRVAQTTKRPPLPPALWRWVNGF